jgi:ketosteroid isomerase-like protein
MDFSPASLPRATGAATQLAGHRMTVYRKQSNGRWPLARDAHTLSTVANLSS